MSLRSSRRASRRTPLATALTLGTSALLLASAHAAGAQSMPGAIAKRAAQNAVAATNAHTQAMTSPTAGNNSPAGAVGPTTLPGQSPSAAQKVDPKRPAQNAAATQKGAAPATAAQPGSGDLAAAVSAAKGGPAAAATAPGAKGAQQQQSKPAPHYSAGGPGGGGSTVSVSEAGSATQMNFQRETFEYAAHGRRDPFISLIRSGELRPLFTDLKLVTVLYDPTGRNSVAIMRDRETKDQYRVKVGQTLGRMRVTQIQPKQVVFALEEFGYSRQEVLGLQSDTTKARKK